MEKALFGFIPGSSREGWVATDERGMAKTDEPVTLIAEALL